MVKVVQVGVLRIDNRTVLKQIGTVRVDERIEAQAGAPGVGEVGDVDARIAMRLALAPQEQCIFGGTLLAGLVLLILSETNCNYKLSTFAM